MDRYDLTITISRYLVMAGGVLGTLYTLPTERYSLFILCILFYTANSQIRLLFTKSLYYLISILADSVLIIMIALFFKGNIIFLVFVTLIDILLNKQLNNLTVMITGIMFSLIYVYLMIDFKSFERVFPLALFYITAFLVMVSLRKELLSKINMEMLYDELKRSHHELGNARASLVDYSKQVERITKLEERHRISRELHDSVGHNLTGILMQVDAATQLMEVDKVKGMAILRSAYNNINNSIEAVRQTVRAMRPNEDQSRETSLLELIDKFKRDTGIMVEYKTSGIPYELFPSVRMVLYRNVQEALTNAVRHGEATFISVHLVFKSDSIEMIVSDNGWGCTNIKKGFGLSGIEERLEIIGGNIRYETENGFSLHMILPVKEVG